MNYWMDTVETIPADQGFALFGPQHLTWLVLILLFVIGSSLVYRKLNSSKRETMRKLYAALLVADELFKMAFLFIGGRWLPNYLPVHLCSINIFVIAFHVFRPSKGLGNFLYTVCIPAALAALLTPSWTELPPLMNCMTIHSFTVHALLVAYPVMQVAGGDIKPSHRYIGKCVVILLGLAVVALVVNLIFDTNFMFIMEAEPGTPLVWFAEHMGSHLLGFPILISAVLLVMHGPIYLFKRLQKQPV